MMKTLQISDDLSFVIMLVAGWLLICHPLTLFIALYLCGGKYTLNLIKKYRRAEGYGEFIPNKSDYALIFGVWWLWLIIGWFAAEGIKTLLTADVKPILENKYYTLRSPIVLHPRPSENEIDLNKYEGARRH